MRLVTFRSATRCIDGRKLWRNGYTTRNLTTMFMLVLWNSVKIWRRAYSPSDYMMSAYPCVVTLS